MSREICYAAIILVGALMLLVRSFRKVAPPAAEPGSERRYVIQVNILRGLACLLVLVAHAHLLRWNLNLGGIGVGIFFLVSGYVIPISLTSCGSAGSFMLRRCFRI